MQHGSLRAPVRVFMAAVLLCLTFLAAPKAAAAQLQDVNGNTLLSFDSQQIVSIGNQTSGRCSNCCKPTPNPGSCMKSCRPGGLSSYI